MVPRSREEALFDCLVIEKFTYVVIENRKVVIAQTKRDIAHGDHTF